MIRDKLAGAVAGAVDAVIEAAGENTPVGDLVVPPIEMDRPRIKEHGDWSTNVALALAKAAGMQPRELAKSIVAALPTLPEIDRVEIAGPGFINFVLHNSWLTGVVRDVEEAGPSWGRITEPETKKIQVEFVSANPTGPLHLGHGRWAAIGDALASVLAAAGHTVEREFYVNDYGRQMDLFGSSIAARYLELFGRAAEIPEGGYQGVYVKELAQEIKDAEGDRYLAMSEEERVAAFRDRGRDKMIEHQQAVLARLGVRFDVWFSETSLHESGQVAAGIEALKKAGHTYELDGALWLRTTDFGDDKDRVVVRSDGTTTYLAPDVAYYLSKKGRGFDRLIYLWGADHHGYVERLRAVIAALGDDPDEAEFMIGQMVNLLRGGEPARMSKRTGEFVTFDELIEEVGADAARYHFIRVSPESHMDFDIDLAIRESQENPVYYVQYAHARIASILRYAEERGVAMKPVGDVELELLREEAELDLLRKIAELPEIVEVASRLRSPMRIPRYAEELAAQFHAFYRDCRVVTEDAELTQARLHLATAAKITLANALAFIGVSAPEKMERTEEDAG